MQSRGDHHRDVCIIPVSAHGTNPASAAMCGMKIVAVGTDSKGNINIEELRNAAEANKNNLAALMVWICLVTSLWICSSLSLSSFDKLVNQGYLSFDSWSVRGGHWRDLQDNPWQWWTSLHGWSQHECSGKVIYWWSSFRVLSFLIMCYTVPLLRGCTLLSFLLLTDLLHLQVGLTSPGFIGADVCHLNLHKTFCIPHGGGGPGMGPIGVKKHLAPFLPSHPVVRTKAIESMCSCVM